MLHDETFALDAAKIYKALGEPTRVRIVELLCKQKELACVDIAERLNLSAGSTLSHHLKQLVDCGVVKLTRVKTFHYHTVREDILKKYAPIFLE